MATILNFGYTNTAQSKDGSSSLTLYTSVGIGDILVIVTAGDGPVTTVSNGLGLTFSQAVVATNSGNVVTQIWYCVATTGFGGSAGFSPIWQDTGYSRAAIGYIIRGLTSPSFDKSSAATGNGTSPSSGATGTLTSNDSVVVGAVGTEGPDGDAAGTWTTGSGNVSGNEVRIGTTGAGDAGNITISAAIEVLSTTTAQTAEKTGTTSRDWAAAVATFKSASVTARRRALLGVGM